MNTIEAKRIRIVDYLRLLGHEPVKVRGGQYWYLSPLRKEDTPSFKVNDRLNEWYDFGLSEGGSIIELAMLFLRTSSVSEVLRLIEVQTGAAPLLRTRPHNAMPDAIEEMMKGVEVVPLNHHALLSYIHSRGYRYADRPAVLSGDTLRTAQAALLRHRLRERIGRLRDAQSLL